MSDGKVCGATFIVGDAKPFVCTMSPHKGRHSYDGNQFGKYPFFVMWEGDMRIVCEKCGVKTDQESFCRVCHKEICENCLFTPNERPRTWDDHHCKECSLQEESLNPT